MKRLGPTLLLVVLGVSLGADAGPFLRMRRLPGRVSAGGGGGAAASNDAQAFFTTYASSMTGNWYGFNGQDGSAPAGSALTWTANNSPTFSALSSCPASKYTGFVGASSQYFVSANQTSPTGSFSACADVYITASGSEQVIIGKDTDSPANQRSFTFETGGTGTIMWLRVHNAAGNNTTCATLTGAYSLNAFHFICATYTYVADTTSVGRIYVDGTQVDIGDASCTAMRGPPAPATSSPVSIGRRMYSTAQQYLTGRIRFAFVTDTVLSGATISAMNTTAAGCN